MNETTNTPLAILLVDDSGFTRKRVRQLLQQDGYVLLEADSGVSALERLKEHEFDCILTDLVMPDMDGFALLAELQKRHDTTPVVVLTADIQRSTRERCEVLGARALVQKPVNSESLRAALSGILGGRC